MISTKLCKAHLKIKNKNKTKQKKIQNPFQSSNLNLKLRTIQVKTTTQTFNHPLTSNHCHVVHNLFVPLLEEIMLKES